LAKKKDTLIDEAKKIKAELDELKRKKKSLDSAKKTVKKQTINKNRKTFVINSAIYKTVKNNVAESIIKYSTSSSDSQIINCMILHAFKSNFGINNIDSCNNDFEKKYSKNTTSRKTITLDKVLYKEILKISSESLIRKGSKISDSKTLNLLIYYASENNFNYSLIPEYISILKKPRLIVKSINEKQIPEGNVKCKICNSIFRYPTEKEVEYQTCHICAKKEHPTRTEVSIGTKVEIIHTNFQDKQENIEGLVQQIITPGDWHYEGLMVYLDNGYKGRVKKVITKEPINVENNVNYARLIENESIGNPKINEIKKLKQKQNDLSERIIQIDIEINDIKIKEEKIKKEIFHEKNLKEKREGSGISKIFSKFSNKNKPLDEYSIKFFQTKNKELNQIEIERKDKLVEQKKVDIEIRSIREEIVKIEEFITNEELIEESDKIISETDERIRQGEEDNNSTKGGICKGMCKQFKATRPSDGKRYDSGQARCQICEQWIDYRGAHLKNNIPATVDSVGWYCNCCNYRVRKKPRNKFYKEKLREDYKEISHRISNEIRPNITQSDIERFVNSKNLKNPQPSISILNKFVNLANQFANESITDIFEMRYKIGFDSENTIRNQRSIINNFDEFLKLDTPKKPQIQSHEIKNSKESLNVDIEKINNWITDALILIKNRPNGILQSEIQKVLSISEDELKILIPKLLRIENILEEQIGRGENIVNRILTFDKNKEVKPKEAKISENDKEIKEITYKMVAEHIHWKTNINKKLKIELIDSYLKHKSMSKVYDEFSKFTKLKIRLHLTTNIRLPTKLKEIESGGELHSNPTCSIVIALYATDYFNWDGESENENEIINFAKEISNYLKIDSNLNRLFEGKK